MTRTSDHGRRDGCSSSRKKAINVGWRKTAHMATSHPRILEEVWVALVAGLELEHYRWHCLRRGGATPLWASSNRHARRWVGIAVSGAALHETEACMEVRGEGRAAGAGL